MLAKDCNNTPQKSIVSIQDTNIFQQFVSKIDRNVLSNFIVENCDWDIKNLSQLVHKLKNISTSANFDGFKWIQNVQPMGYQFSDKYSFGFKDLQVLQVESIVIDKDFFNVFSDSLKSLTIEDCTFADNITIHFLNQFFRKSKQNTIETLSLWLWKYGDSPRHQIFTNYLVCSPALKSLSIRLGTESKHTPDLSPIVGSKLETLHLFEMNKFDLDHIINRKSNILSLLKKCKYLHSIILDAESMLYKIIPNLEQNSAITSEMSATVTQIYQLFCIFKNVLHDLQKAYHNSDGALNSFGALDIKGIIDQHFIKIFNENYECNHASKLDRLQMDIRGLQDMIKLLDSKLMKVSNGFKLVLFESVFLRKIFDMKPAQSKKVVSDTLGKEMALDDMFEMGLDNMIRNIGSVILLHPLIAYKTFSERHNQRIVVLESVNNENKVKLKELISIKTGLQFGQSGKESEEKECKSESDSEDFEDRDFTEEGEGFVKQVQENGDLLKNYDLPMLQQFIVSYFQFYKVSTDAFKDISETENETESEEDLVTAIMEKLEAENEWYAHAEKQHSLQQKISENNRKIELLKHSKNIAKNVVRIEIIEHLTTHFEYIYSCIGPNAAKNTLFLVNKQMFQLCANKIFAYYAQRLYKININGIESDQTKFSFIQNLNINDWILSRDDLYPLSLLHKIKSFRVGMLEYDSHDNITTFDIHKCFKNWKMLTHLDLWHLNDDCGSRYDGNPLNAELTNTLLQSSMQTLVFLHVAFYGTDCMYSRWRKCTDARGNAYYKYMHHSDDKEKKHECVYPNFNILSQSNACVLEHFSFWTRASNQSIMNNIYKHIKQIKSIKKISIQVENSAFSMVSPDEDMTGEEWKELVLKWKDILTMNGGNRSFHGELVLHGITLKWFALLVKNDKNDWFWDKECNNCNVQLLKVEDLYQEFEDVTDLFDFMKLSKESFVDKVYLRFLTVPSMDYKYYGKMALLEGFYTQRGMYQNQVILSQITKENWKEVENKMLEYIEEKDPN